MAFYGRGERKRELMERRGAVKESETLRAPTLNEWRRKFSMEVQADHAGRSEQCVDAPTERQDGLRIMAEATAQDRAACA